MYRGGMPFWYECDICKERYEANDEKLPLAVRMEPGKRPSEWVFICALHPCKVEDQANFTPHRSD